LRRAIFEGLNGHSVARALVPIYHRLTSHN
jgi:hypothetical protein